MALSAPDGWHARLTGPLSVHERLPRATAASLADSAAS